MHQIDQYSKEKSVIPQKTSNKSLALSMIQNQSGLMVLTHLFLGQRPFRTNTPEPEPSA